MPSCPNCRTDTPAHALHTLAKDGRANGLSAFETAATDLLAGEGFGVERTKWWVGFPEPPATHRQLRVYFYNSTDAVEAAMFLRGVFVDDENVVVPYPSGEQRFVEVEFSAR